MNTVQSSLAGVWIHLTVCWEVTLAVLYVTHVSKATAITTACNLGPGRLSLIKSESKTPDSLIQRSRLSPLKAGFFFNSLIKHTVWGEGREGGWVGGSSSAVGVGAQWGYNQYDHDA